MINILEEIVSQVFKKLGYNEFVTIIRSNRPDLCDYQCDDVFKLAKIYHQSPIEIGEKIVAEINKISNFNKYFKDVTFIKPGFINIVISDELINQVINDMMNKPNFNLKKQEKEELYFLDYGGPNVAKPLHVGHLRTAIIGESVKRIINFVGNKTMADVHLGDYGLQIGEVIYAILEDGINKEDITLEYLDVTYPKMSQICKENSEILEKCANITKELQEGNQIYNELWKKIKEVSIKDIKRIYDYLNVSFDLWEGESDGYPYISEMTKQLEEKSLLKDSLGAKVIEVSNSQDNKEMPPLIYQKSNGAYLYGTTDLAAIYERIVKYQPNHILYVVDQRQGLHFEQVFRASKKWGITDNVTLKHLGYGTVNGVDGKPFKTRSGDTVKLDSLFEIVKDAFIKTKQGNENMNNDDLQIIVNSIIKFADLQNNREKDYIFDPNKFSNVVGKTGPYILYTYLRINKILSQEKLEISSLNDIIYNDVDRNLRLKIIEMPIAVNNAFVEKMPHYIAEYIYELCVLANVFYQNNHITGLENKNKQQWLLLLTLMNRILKELLNLLAIKIPSKM